MAIPQRRVPSRYCGQSSVETGALLSRYDPLLRNCNHFSAAFCGKLDCDRTVPAWVNRAPSIAAAVGTRFRLRPSKVTAPPVAWSVLLPEGERAAGRAPPPAPPRSPELGLPRAPPGAVVLGRDVVLTRVEETTPPAPATTPTTKSGGWRGWLRSPPKKQATPPPPPVAPSAPAAPSSPAAAAAAVPDCWAAALNDEPPDVVVPALADVFVDKDALVDASTIVAGLGAVRVEEA